MSSKCIIILFFLNSVVPPIQNSVVLEIQLFDFTISDETYNLGKNCEKLLKCVSTFDICLSNATRFSKCELLKERKIFENQYQIANVFNSKLLYAKKPDTLVIHVKFTNNYTMGTYSNIFTISFTPQLNFPYVGFLTPKYYVENARFQYKLKFYCQSGYEGDNCKPLCQNEHSIQLCLMNRCKAKCKHGSCIANETSHSFYCKCKHGWQGDSCSNNIIPCRNSLCDPKKLICNDNYCTCHYANSTAFSCKKTKELDFKANKIQKNNSSLYIFAGIPVILALLGLIGFISVSLWRYYHYYSIPRVSSPLFQNIDDIENELSSNTTYKMSPVFCQSRSEKINFEFPSQTKIRNV